MTYFDESSDDGSDISNKKWTVVVTTAPREKCTLLQTLDYLKNAGFDPVVFAEPGSTVSGCLTFHNEKRLGVWHNWLKAANWALTQKSDYILTMQDDVSLHPDSKSFIESIKWPRHAGYISLYTPKHYQMLPGSTRPRDKGMYPIVTNSMWGALALVFKPEILKLLVKHPRAASWLGARTRTKSAWDTIRERRRANPELIQNSDTIIGSIVSRSLRRRLFYFNPSPACHIAEVSSLEGHGTNTMNRNAYFIADHSIPLKDQIPINKKDLIQP